MLNNSRLNNIRLNNSRLNSFIPCMSYITLGSVHKWRHLKFGFFRPPPPSVIFRHFCQTPPLDDVIFHRPPFLSRRFSAKLYIYGKIEKWQNQDLTMIQIPIKPLLDECDWIFQKKSFWWINNNLNINYSIFLIYL